MFEIKSEKINKAMSLLGRAVGSNVVIFNTETNKALSFLTLRGKSKKQGLSLSGASSEQIISAESKKNQLRYSVNCSAIPKYDHFSFGFAKVLIFALILTLITTAELWADINDINCETGQQSCGTSCCWSVENQKLTITGGKDGTVGTMDDYSWGKTGQNTQWPANITSIYVSGVENIGAQAFRNMKKVTNITIGDSVERVGAGAFDNEKKLRYVDFGDAVTSIGSSALQDSNSLVQVIIPDTLNDIAYQSLGDYIPVNNVQIICRGDKASCSNIYEKLTEYSVVKGQTYDATGQLFYADYKTCASTNYYWDGAKCVREPDLSKRTCCADVCKDMGGWCNRIRYTPAEAAQVLRNDDKNEVVITFKK